MFDNDDRDDNARLLTPAECAKLIRNVPIRRRIREWVVQTTPVVNQPAPTPPEVKGWPS